MPQAPVDNKGTELFYTDSGPVPGSNDYTTLVIYHGSAYTGREFMTASIEISRNVHFYGIQIPFTGLYPSE